MSLSQTYASYITARYMISAALTTKGIPSASTHGFATFASDIDNIATAVSFEQRLSGTLSAYNNQSVTSVARGAFAYSPIATISLPNVTWIGACAFQGCNSLTSIAFPLNVTLADGAAGGMQFEGCHNLESVSFPTTTVIGRFKAFMNCTKLSDVYMPEVTGIGEAVFCNCSSLSQISFPKCEYITTEAFANCTSLSSVNLPKCDTVGNNAFAGCTILQSIYLPSCTDIGEYAFKDCSSLLGVNIPLLSATLGEVTGLFDNCACLGNINVESCNYIGSFTFRSCAALENIRPLSCTNVNMGAFAFCQNLSSITLPKCSTIGSWAFQGCTSLSSVTLGNGDDTTETGVIEEFAFQGCENLSTLILPSQGTEIVTIPDWATCVFEETPIEWGTGSIYVPSSLLSAYKEADYWSNYASQIYPIS